MSDPVRVTFRVAGVTFQPNYPENLWALAGLLAQDPHLEVTLTRDPDNEHDSAAVSVAVPALISTGHPAMIGHVPSDVNRDLELSASLKAGDLWVVELRRVQMKAGSERRPGVEVRVTKRLEET